MRLLVFCILVIIMPEIIFPDSPPIKIVQQPDGDYAWVSDDPNVFTQFSQADRKFGTAGFLAHSYGAGKQLFNLKVGDVITYIDRMNGSKSLSDWAVRKIKVKEIRKYQTLNPKDVLSPLVNLDSGERVKAEDTTDELYRNNKRTIFQTCIEKDGNPNWGRMFVIAE